MPKKLPASGTLSCKREDVVSMPPNKQERWGIRKEDWERLKREANNIHEGYAWLQVIYIAALTLGVAGLSVYYTTTEKPSWLFPSSICCIVLFIVFVIVDFCVVKKTKGISVGVLKTDMEEIESAFYKESTEES